jgi:hypothetical protein
MRTSIRSSILSLCLGLLSAGPALSQWAQLPGASGSDLHVEGFLSVTTAPGGVMGFSAHSQRWDTLAPGLHVDPAIAMDPLQTGDFVALLRTSLNTYRAWSARLCTYADISFANHPDQMYWCVQDDVILAIGWALPEDNGIYACAYSGQTGTWVKQLIPGYLDTACSRFVLGVLDTTGVAHAFSARHGVWSSTACGAGGDLEADGNVLTAKTYAGATALNPVLAFSGVRGTWATSPLPHPGASLFRDHDVAFVKTQGTVGATARSCAYSAYEGQWVELPVNYPIAALQPHLSDKTVLVEGTNGAGDFAFHAFGALPGQWATTTVPSTSGMAWFQNADAILVDAKALHEVRGFSGVRAAIFTPEVYAGTLTLALGGEHLAIARDSAGAVHAYSPARTNWSVAPLVSTTASLAVGAAVASFEDATQRYAYSARDGAWFAGPAKFAGSTYASVLGGSLYGEIDATGAAAGTFQHFHERRGAWVMTPIGGLGLPLYYPGRNALLVDATAVGGLGLVAISAQRGDAIPAPGFAGSPVAPPIVEENVVIARDVLGVLHAYGSANPTHAQFQYPLCTETQGRVPPATSPCPMRFGVRGMSGQFALLALSAAPNFTGTTLPFASGSVLLNVGPGAFLGLYGMGLIGASGIAAKSFGGLLVGPPLGLEIWSQGVLVDPATGATAMVQPMPEPAWIF